MFEQRMKNGNWSKVEKNKFGFLVHDATFYKSKEK